jgi:hypothetical protein
MSDKWQATTLRFISLLFYLAKTRYVRIAHSQVTLDFSLMGIIPSLMCIPHKHTRTNFFDGHSDEHNYTEDV